MYDDYYTFECQTCGAMIDVEASEIDFDMPSVRCSRCGTTWEVEIFPGELWLEPVQEVEHWI